MLKLVWHGLYTIEVGLRTVQVRLSRIPLSYISEEEVAEYESSLLSPKYPEFAEYESSP